MKNKFNITHKGKTRKSWTLTDVVESYGDSVEEKKKHNPENCGKCKAGREVFSI